MTIEARAQAKINLTLHVTGQRPDGYHLLDSLVVFADIHDHVRFEPGPKLSLEVTGPFAAGVPTDARNLVWRAAELAGWSGHIHLHKSLPHGAGIGGGSADAAALLRAVNAPDHGASLGADVPVCLAGVPQRMAGIGENLELVPGVPDCPAVLVNPNVIVSTPTVFGALQRKDNMPMGALPLWHDKAAFMAWLGGMHNDLEEPAIACAPVIRHVLEALADASLVRMSGSGATCFGLYDSVGAARAAAKRIACEEPTWWVRAVTLGGSVAN